MDYVLPLSISIKNNGSCASCSDFLTWGSSPSFTSCIGRWGFTLAPPGLENASVKSLWNRKLEFVYFLQIQENQNSIHDCNRFIGHITWQQPGLGIHPFIVTDKSKIEHVGNGVTCYKVNTTLCSSMDRPRWAYSEGQINIDNTYRWNNSQILFALYK